MSEYDPQRDYSFNKEIEDLPALNASKARIMVYRPAAYSGALIRYNMSVVYNPSFIDDSDKIDKEAPKLFLGVARPGSAFYRDIEPSDKEIVIHSATESQYNLPLKIQANKIYCIMAKR